MAENVIDGVHGALQPEHYVKPEQPRILERLEWFMDQKLALMMHWGIYSQLGMVESWALSDQDAEWSRNIDWEIDSKTFKEEYKNLNRSFNPIRFEPQKWANAAYDGGFKYLIFTTKHHDGFCMWDSKFTNYKVTHSSCPFYANKRADIAAHTFEAFRRKGIGIAAYFSKADWHTPYYWADNQFKSGFTSRGPSYIPAEQPELWDKFVQFTHNQVMELVTQYGKIDILWFDAGWVCPPAGQDIKIEELIQKARRVQPWLISADRTCGGIAENYITPEQSVPKSPIAVPWESCISMGNGFAYSYDDNYKSTKTLLHLLIDIVAKGGNLALNVAPQPDGRLPRPALARMKEMGAWLKQYGEAIYDTRICVPFVKDNCYFTQNVRKGKVYVFYIGESDICIIPYTDKKVTSVKNMTDNSKIDFIQHPNGVKFSFKTSTPSNLYGSEHIAEVFELDVE